MVDPDRFRRRIGEDIIKRKVSFLPENPPKGKISPEIVIGHISGKEQHEKEVKTGANKSGFYGWNATLEGSQVKPSLVVPQFEA